MTAESRSRIVLWLGQTLALAAAIFVTGRLALMMAVSPGDATPIFPPAGIALAALLLYGNRIAPGVFLGSLLMNSTLSPVATAAGIAMGSTLQALLAAWLVRRFVGFPTALALERKAIGFVVLGGPLACVLSATVGTVVLYFTGGLDAAEREFNWLNWWVGDSMGVILFAPLVLTLLGKPRDSWRPRKLTLGIPLLLLAAAASIAFVYAAYREHANIELEFERQIDTRLQVVRRRMGEYENVLRSIHSLYASSMEVERDEFRSFVTGALQRHPEIQALEWVPRVSDAQREEFRQRAREDGEHEKDESLAKSLQDFEITRQPTEQQSSKEPIPQAQSSVYYPVYFVEPFEDNEAALGYDLGSEPECRRALEKARDSGAEVATGRIHLLQGDATGYACLALIPIFQNEAETQTITDRRRHLLGYVLGVFRISNALQAALAGIPSNGIRLQLNDLSAPPGQQLLFEQATVAGAHDDACKIDASREFAFADRRWSLTFEATPAFVQAQHIWQAWAMPVVVLLFTGMAVTFLLVATGHAMEVQQLVDQRTAELSEINAQLKRSNQDLEQFAYVASHDLQEPLRAVSGFCSLLKSKYDQALDERGRSYVDFAVDGASRMQRLLLGLLEFSRVNTQPVKRTPADCNQLLEEALANLKSSLQESGARVEHAPLPTVEADPSQMVQLLQNLVANAIKYCDKGSPEIEVAAREETNGWTFSVRDNGIGIGPAHGERVFVIFQRLHTRAEYEGTGIGLAVCKRIVERHDGRIWVESTPGVGSTFFFTIPDSGAIG